MAERTRRAPEQVAEPGARGRAAARRSRPLPPRVAERLEPGEQALVRRPRSTTLLGCPARRLPPDGVAVQRGGARGPDHRVDRGTVALFPGVERLERVLLPALEVAEQILRRPLAATEARGRPGTRAEGRRRARTPRAYPRRRCGSPDASTARARRRDRPSAQPTSPRPGPATTSRPRARRPAPRRAARPRGRRRGGSAPASSAPSTGAPTATTRPPRSRIQPMISGSNREPANSSAR